MCHTQQGNTMQENNSCEAADLQASNLENCFAGDGLKVLLLDYDGTLRAFEDDPAQAIPDQDLLQLLDSFNRREDLRVVIISGRTASFLEEHMGHFKQFTFVAEHGSQVRKSGRSRWEATPCTPVGQSRTWRMVVLNCVRKMENRFEGGIKGSFVEEKAKSMVWHYRGAPDTVGYQGALELLQLLGAEYPPDRVIHGNKMVEVFGPKGTSKGAAMNELLDEFKVDYASLRTVLCVGDDVTDESMFKVQRSDLDIKSVKVGEGPTCAQYRVASPHEFLKFLRKI
eukprot:GEMP01031836.1.p1 GENE.GEMP01031836.1~~GEMP01031836.1.p1  ORF type:complete len:283 (-),score=56.00 GEMP01031836.1:1259-2107(-)